MNEFPRVIVLMEYAEERTRGILRGIARYVKLFGPWTIFSDQSLYLEPWRKKTIFFHLRTWQPTGIIAGIPSQKIAEEFLDKGVPTIAFCEREDLRGFPAVIVLDHTAVGSMAADYFVKCGFKNFAFCGYNDHPESFRLASSFQKNLADANFDLHVYKTPTKKEQTIWSNEQSLITKWLQSLPKPVGLLVTSDIRGRDCIEACRISGLRIPEDVSILGINNDELLCNMANPPLSSIAMDFEKVGYDAAKLLNRLMVGEKIENQIIQMRPTHVVTRTSTDIAAIEDHEVSEAIRFIRFHSKQPIQVDEVATAIGLSRRSLYERFKAEVGRSVHDEITRVRIEQIVQMLLETSLPISEIAKAMGFPGVDHIARYFKKKKGLSLSEFRKQNGFK